MKKIFSILFVLILATACEDENFSDVPDIDFRYTFFLDDTEFFNFTQGMSKEVDVNYYGDSLGYAGLILYYASNDFIYAFDRCCPIHVDEKERLETTGALAMCPTDSIYFSLLDDPSVAINKEGSIAILKSYRTSKNGTTLVVYN